MTDTQNNRLRTASRIPVCYPVMFQTDWHIDEVGLLTLSQPRCPIESSRCRIADEYVRLRGFSGARKGPMNRTQSVRSGISQDAGGSQT